MELLEAQHLKYYIMDRLIVDVEKLQIYKNDKIGLVGRNGSGKTTLLELLAGIRTADEGMIIRRGTYELLPQLKKTDTSKSGGEITQQYINEALVKDPAILFADEPTTNLDAPHLEWLEKKLSHWPGALIIVSHDRAFLDALCTTIWEIHEGHIKEYKGNYSDYAKQKKLEREQHELAYDTYYRKKTQLEEALTLKKQKAAKATKKPTNVSSSEARIIGAKPYFAKKEKKLQKTAKTIETRLEKLEKVDKPRVNDVIKMSLPEEDAFKRRIVLRAEQVEGRVGKRMLWQPANFHISGGDKLAIIGPNGCGKTTLVKKIIHRDMGVSISPSMKIGYFSQNLNILTPAQTILENVSNTSKQTETFIRTILARLHFYRKDVYKPVEVLSGGERVKVALAKLFVSEVNTLVLDEPTNFLDIEAVEALESLLCEYEGTIIFVSHDRRFIEKVATRILSIHNMELMLFEGTYKEYSQYTSETTRDVLEDQRLLLETKISEILSRLSVEPSKQLEKEFQELLAAKRKLDSLS